MTETNTNMSLRQVLRIIRQDMADRDYLSGYLEYACDQGAIHVRNAPAAESGSVLIGRFVAELLAPNGQTAKTYRV